MPWLAGTLFPEHLDGTGGVLCLYTMKQPEQVSLCCSMPRLGSARRNYDSPTFFS